MDRRKGTEKIGDTYEWDDMHHFYCLIRQHYTNAIVDKNTIGTIFIVPAIQHPDVEPFDYMDNKPGKTVMIRMDEFCILCVLNDSCMVYSLFSDDLAKINGSMTPYQLANILG